MAETLNLTLDRMETPIGTLLVTTDAEGCLRALDWSDYEDRMNELLRRHYGKAGYGLTPGRAPMPVTAALRGYFAGNFAAIDTLPVATNGTDFQRGVWRELRRIPCGRTISYGELARRLDRPAAMRAVGLANGANPVSVVVPCHRVIGADGSLTGYGGGLERKRWLLAHEGARV